MILGLDISSSIVGVCELTDDGEFFSASYIDLRKKQTWVEKSEATSDWFDENLSVDVKTIYAEEKLSGFAGGKTSQQTLLKLAAFNGIVSWIVYDKSGIAPIHLHPSTVKATVKRDGLIIEKGANKKLATLKFALSIEKFPYEETKMGNPQPYCFDMADAYITARAGFLKHCESKKK